MTPPRLDVKIPQSLQKTASAPNSPSRHRRKRPNERLTTTSDAFRNPLPWLGRRPRTWHATFASRNRTPRRPHKDRQPAAL